MTGESSAWMMSVHDGQACIGFLLQRGRHGVEAFDRDSRSLGAFRVASGSGTVLNLQPASGGAAELTSTGPNALGGLPSGPPAMWRSA
jgi:hypothetical protein